MKPKLTLLYIALTLFICAASIFILHHTYSASAVSATKDKIDSYTLNANFTEYNQAGLIQTTIHAEKITHYEPSGTTTFQKLFIITYANDRTPWHIHADQASMDKTQQKIILQGNVVAHELPTAQHPEATIKTSELILFPKESRAMTSKPVTLSRPGATIHGIGLTANLKTGEYELLSESDAVYQPQHQPKPS